MAEVYLLARRDAVEEALSAKEDIVEKMADKARIRIKKILAPWINIIQKAVNNSSELSSLDSAIPKLYPKLKSKLAVKLFQELNTLSNLVGRDEINDETREDADDPNWIKQPFAEAIAYFRKKVNIPTRSWKDFQAEQHELAFTVAGLTRADLLEEARKLVDSAIASGEDIETFKKKFKERIVSKGWSADDQRIYTILDTNSRRSYAAGRYQQATTPDVLERRPYWVWKHRDSVVPRPHHLALNNKAIAADDPFWKVATPSCGYLCRCTFFPVNERMVKRMGYQILDNPPDPKTIAEPGFQRAAGSIPEQERQEILDRGLDGLSVELQEEVKKEINQQSIHN